MRCALTPFSGSGLTAAKGEAAMAEVDAVRRSTADWAPASVKAPGAVPGRLELLSGAAPDEACAPSMSTTSAEEIWRLHWVAAVLTAT